MHRTAIALLVFSTACGGGTDHGTPVDAGGLGWTACTEHWIDSAGEQIQQRSFDAQGRWVHDTWAFAGQPVYAIDDYTWDDDRVIEARESGPTGALRVDQRFLYDGAHRLTRYELDGTDGPPATPADGFLDYAEQYEYDPQGHLAKVRFDDNGDGILELSHQEVLTWNARGCIANTFWLLGPNAGTERDTFTDRADCQPLRIDDDLADDGTIDSSVTFAYDDAGRITAYHGLDNDDRTYTYDDAGRIVEITRTDSKQTFDYCAGAQMLEPISPARAATPPGRSRSARLHRRPGAGA